ncbi:MAG TPA: FAD-dependent oxidoreductase [Chloroflexota bacterium]|nr:FAD-dependent oxidoreductase [Chloroflexota bacterium]
MTASSFDTLVVGGGVIGCAIAWELAKRGQHVGVLERDAVGCGASGMAAGMLAPQSEAHAPDAWFQLLLAARQLHRELVDQLREESGVDVRYRPDGAVRVALDDDEARELRDRAGWQRAAGLRAEWLCSDAARRLEPGLTPSIAGALWAPDEAHVSAEHVTEALRIAARRRGVTFRERTAVTELVLSGDAVSGLLTLGGDLLSGDMPSGVRTAGGDMPSGARTARGDVVSGVRTARGDVLSAGAVVLATGPWMPPLPSGGCLPMGPVKGQIVVGRGAPLQHVVWGRDAYLVPKAGQRVFIGATEEEGTFDARPTLGAVGELIGAGSRLVPAVQGLVLQGVRTGLRPATPDRRPVLGRWPGVAGLYVAGGHFRNGILLAPLTGRLIAQLMSGETPDHELAPYSPARITCG